MNRLPLVALLVAFALGASAAGPPRPPDRLPDYLELSDTQKEAWRTMHRELRTSTRALFEQRDALHEALEDARDANEIGAITLQLRAIRTQLDTARDAAHAKFKLLLTTEQKNKFEAFQAAVEFTRQHGPGGGPPR